MLRVPSSSGFATTSQCADVTSGVHVGLSPVIAL
nr:MAG TPA: hypothetical protein [Caudoviricetes sp.]